MFYSRVFISNTGVRLSTNVVNNTLVSVHTRIEWEHPSTFWHGADVSTSLPARVFLQVQHWLPVVMTLPLTFTIWTFLRHHMIESSWSLGHRLEMKCGCQLQETERQGQRSRPEKKHTASKLTAKILWLKRTIIKDNPRCNPTCLKCSLENICHDITIASICRYK